MKQVEIIMLLKQKEHNHLQERKQPESAT